MQARHLELAHPRTGDCEASAAGTPKRRRRSSFHDVVRCPLGTAFDAWAERDAARTDRRRVPGAVVREPIAVSPEDCFGVGGPPPPRPGSLRFRVLLFITSSIGVIIYYIYILYTYCWVEARRPVKDARRALSSFRYNWLQTLTRWRVPVFVEDR
ncbi:unnamed protein product [Ixodes pacificus]